MGILAAVAAAFPSAAAGAADRKRAHADHDKPPSPKYAPSYFPFSSL